MVEAGSDHKVDWQDRLRESFQELAHHQQHSRALDGSAKLLSKAPINGGYTVDQAREDQELQDWWERLAKSDIVNMLPKARERGGNDLYEVGRALGAIAEWQGSPNSEEEARAELVELGIWFYVIGKMARVQAALERGEVPDEDTTKDLRIYMMMIERVRSVGNWPWPA